ncbi:Short-chain-enoyl-CoA hydratase [bioreactor metagenome]|uniref:Short-chain-enoyl-CoA hydratase n=1 Tax=bioreactor metagenome TaxID=1076179 RepID=A0A644SV01_9ZZZZ|nr:enoyl-CoA hydratase-related protein [Negativicutes bacterium]
MEETTVLYEKNDRVAILTLNRPMALNSLNQQMVDELMAALASIKADKGVRVVILTGSGRAFSAGGDLNYLESIAGTPAAHEFISQVGKLVAIIMDLPQPVVAMVNGAAAGAGFNLALACDLVIASKGAKFAQSFVKVGLVPDCGGMYLLPRLAGLSKAKELMFTADIIGAEEAARLGLVNKVVESDELGRTVAELAEKLTTAAPLAIAHMKRVLNKSDELTLQESLSMEAELQAESLATADYLEGVKAFREKRQPVFQGK